MTTIAPPPGVRIGPQGLPQYSLGEQIFVWAKTRLLQPDGPRAGQPWNFTTEQLHFLAWWYACDRMGRFIYRRGMLRRMKGWGKDPLGAAICCIEFVGPCRVNGFRNGRPVGVAHDAAWVQTAAVAKEQTRNTMTLFPGMFSPKAVDEYGIDLGAELIFAQRRRKRIEAVTSSPRALEGGRATFILKNETHHWIKSNEGLEMSAVIARNAAKSRDGASRVLAISNAHQPGEGSDAERDYDAYLAIASGRSKAGGFLYDSLEAPPDTELADPESLRNGLLASRGESEWLDVDRLVEEIMDPQTEPSVARRYYLNQIIAAEDAWLAPVEWDACAVEGETVEDGEQITLGMDGSRTNDHTVLMGCRVSDSYLFPLGIFEPADSPDNIIETAQVDVAVRSAFAKYDVVGFYSDVHEWESYTDTWEQDYGDQLCARSTDRHPVKWDMRRAKESTLAAEAYHTSVIDRSIAHANDARINQYHYNARRRPNPWGVSFSKESSFSSRKVDGLAAAILARKARQDYLSLPDGRQRQRPTWHGINLGQDFDV